MKQPSFFVTTAALFAAATSLPLQERCVDFKSILPSPQLNWVPCYNNDKLTCSLLEVPLDYANKSAGTTNIAYIRYSPVDKSLPDFMFNPGGPGVSGVQSVLEEWEFLSRQIAPKYNLISFDPRGVRNSSPELLLSGCSLDDEPSRDDSELEIRKRNLTPEEFSRLVADNTACFKNISGGNMKYAGTVANAQDMAHFIDLHHAQKHPENPSKPKLNYYGTSYGSVIGQVFAALYPDQVGRMVLDGNVDGSIYFSGVDPRSIEDADAGFRDFFDACFKAGPKNCKFHGNSTSAQDIEDRYRAMLTLLREGPLYIKPIMVSQALLSDLVFQALYMVNDFKNTAARLAILEKSLQKSKAESAVSAPSMPEEDNTPYFDEQQLIEAIDFSHNFGIKTYNQYQSLRAAYLNSSVYSGDILADQTLGHPIGFDIQPPPSQQFPGFDANGTNTSFPILFLNNIRDPITPISSARTMSALFPGSVVVAQNATGHTVLGNVSPCSLGAIYSYMVNGSLPEDGTICQNPGVKPFPPHHKEQIKKEKEDMENFWNMLDFLDDCSY